MSAPSPLLARFLEVCRLRADHEALTDDVERVSFRELGERAANVAADLAARGLAGERIGLLATQGAAWLEGFFGILLAGGVVVPLSPLHPLAEQRWFVETSRARALVASRALLAAELAAEREWLEVEALRGAPRPVAPAAVAPASSAAAGADDLAALLYTSGTTGKPKGAMLTHGNLASLAALLQEAWRFTPSDRLVHALPLHHLHGLGIALLPSVLSGGSTHLLGKFDAARVWDALGDATVLMGVPTMHRRLLDALDAAPPGDAARWRENAARLRLVTSGSAALPLTLGERWRALTGEYPLERFGMTEVGVGLTNPVEGPRVPGSCGRPLPGMEIRIAREDGSPCEPGEPGEIWLRGPSVFAGYDEDPAATEAAFTDGWFRSGDTATWLEDGSCRILGRSSVDILKSGGYKLSALELEELFREHPAVADVAVVGLPDETWGEVAVAAVTPRGGVAVPTELEFRSWAKQRVASYKVPKHVLLFSELPRSPIGKVIKPLLAKLVAARLAEGAAQGDGVT